MTGSFQDNMTHCNPGADSLSDSAASYQLLTNNAIDKHFLFILFRVTNIIILASLLSDALGVTAV